MGCDLATLFGSTLIVAPHPDDETLTAGIMIQRMRHAAVAFVTNGAPRTGTPGYGSAAKYAAIREQEARRATATLGVSATVFLGFADQELHSSLGQAFNRLQEIVLCIQPAAVLTTAYEGGHPDHDCCSFLATALRRRLGVAVWKVPVYAITDEGRELWRQFRQPNGTEVIIRPGLWEWWRKRRALRHYVSQHAAVKWLRPISETSRPQPMYDYATPPHSGPLHYERYRWGSGSVLCESFQRSGLL